MLNTPHAKYQVYVIQCLDFTYTVTCIEYFSKKSIGIILYPILSILVLVDIARTDDKIAIVIIHSSPNYSPM